MRRLHDTGSADGMTLSAITQMRTDCDSMEQALHALEASRNAVQARLEQQLLNLSRTKLYAPCDGTVLDTYFEEGEIIPRQPLRSTSRPTAATMTSTFRSAQSPATGRAAQ